ncbi:unnamed protein product [Rotaria magnacalcarata]|uniref:CCHC-type domain-containing protein n=2 Tax=Rotaria magnacalcarata TaxID=392030 RepID=A0A816LR68_9BILA|nr:unnamed protein product [Rotaria magnacalcarata]CAF3840273.1 unnamed protein product [Rotaria magnacalcarata]
MINNILKYFVDIYKVNILLAGHRLKNKRGLLIFVENKESFLILFDDSKWPKAIGSFDYDKTRPNHLPPQFSVILRHVPVEKDINLLLMDLQKDYPDIINAFRLLNRNKLPTSIVRLDIAGVKTIENLSNKKFIYIDNLRLPVTEYLATAKVLICSKCFQIGHLRSNCKSQLEVCGVCGRGVEDLKQHNDCINKKCCIRCSGDHDSNDSRCPDIKSYRAMLTKSLLPSVGADKNHPGNPTTKYCPNGNDFPILNVKHGNQHRGNESFISSGKRIDDLFSNFNKLEENFNRILELNNNSLDELARTQKDLAKHDHELLLQKYDITFQREYVNQFISPLVQVIVEVLPTLVKQNVIQDKTLLCPSLTSVSEKMGNDLTMWTNRFAQNEIMKSKMINDFNMVNHDPLFISPNNNNVNHTMTRSSR